MPMYVYWCSKCYAELELMRPMDSDPESCPKCGALRSLTRQLSRVNFKLKGTGWHATDYPKSTSK